MAKAASTQRKQTPVPSASSTDQPAAANAAQAPSPPQQTREEREGLIAVAAYYRAERRGFAPGRELEDWLAAEAEVAADSPHGEAAAAELH